MLCSFFLICNRLSLLEFERFNIYAKLCGKFSCLFGADFTLWLGCSFLSRRLFDRLFFLDRFCIGIHFDQLAHNWRFYC
jgi:hypothetical protein